MDFFKKYNIHLSKISAPLLLSAIYLGIFWFSFFSKGIFIDGNFYKKSANMTTVTYSCRNPFADYKKIVLQKQKSGAEIIIDNRYKIVVDGHGNWQQTDSTGLTVLPDEPWHLVAQQATETSRGPSSRQPYGVVLIGYILFVLAKIFNPRVYSFFFRNRAAGEGYYRGFNIVFVAVTAVVLVYFILPI